jgi:molybdopterin biosynthesis enzyme
MSIQCKTADLTPEQQARLRKLNDSQQGMQNFIRTMLTAAETRAAALQQEGRELFEELAKAHGLDLLHVQYVPSQDGTKLIPVSVKFDAEG